MHGILPFVDTDNVRSKIQENANILDLSECNIVGKAFCPWCFVCVSVDACAERSHAKHAMHAPFMFLVAVR